MVGHALVGRNTTLRGARPIDKHVGSRLRFRRVLVGMSQRQLGQSVGFTYQQIQKYEKGTAVISAGLLLQLARVLGVSVQFFFEDAPTVSSHQRAPKSIASRRDGSTIIEFVRSPEGAELNGAFAAITRPETRRAIIRLTRSLATSPSRHTGERELMQRPGAGIADGGSSSVSHEPPWCGTPPLSCGTARCALDPARNR